jgi:hypothetical protein
MLEDDQLDAQTNRPKHNQPKHRATQGLNGF